MSQQRSPRFLVGRLETPQQLVQTVQHLLRELFADDVLVLPACFEESRQALSLGQRQEPFSDSSSLSAVQSGRPAVGSMSCTRKSIHPELSPRGAESTRMTLPLKRSPAET